MEETTESFHYSLFLRRRVSCIWVGFCSEKRVDRVCIRSLNSCYEGTVKVFVAIPPSLPDERNGNKEDDYRGGNEAAFEVRVHAKSYCHPHHPEAIPLPPIQ